MADQKRKRSQEAKDAAKYARSIEIKNVCEAVALVAHACEFMNWDLNTPGTAEEDIVDFLVIGTPERVQEVSDAYIFGQAMVNTLPEEAKEALRNTGSVNVEVESIELSEEEMSMVEKMMLKEENEIH